MKIDEAIEILNRTLKRVEPPANEEITRQDILDDGYYYYQDDDLKAIETVLKKLENSISKDKIKAKIEELKQAETLLLQKGEIDLYYFAEDVLKELLKESN